VSIRARTNLSDERCVERACPVALRALEKVAASCVHATSIRSDGASKTAAFDTFIPTHLRAYQRDGSGQWRSEAANIHPRNGAPNCE
jgi:hypothetical protein